MAKQFVSAEEEQEEKALFESRDTLEFNKVGVSNSEISHRQKRKKSYGIPFFRS